MASTLSFRVEVAADQATQSLQVLSQAFNQAGITAKSSLLRVGDGTRAAAEGNKSFEHSLKSLKSEMASGDRTINFFARSLNSIVPEASAAGQGLRLLADGLIGGLGVGFAIQGVMAVMTLFGDHLKETTKRAEESAKAARDAAVMWETLGDSFDRAMSLIGKPKKSWQEEQVERATEATDKAIEEQEKKLREANAKLNQALGDRENVGLFDNGAEERVVAALKEKQALVETLDAMKGLRAQQRAAAADRAAEAGDSRAAESTAVTFYQEERKAREQAAKAAKTIAEAYRQATNELLQAGYISAEKAADKLRVIIDRPVTKAGLYDIKTAGDLGKTNYTQVGFAGGVSVAPLTESDRAAQMGKQVQAIDAQRKAAEEKTKEMVTNIAATWASGLADMVATTDFSAQNMARIFSQMMGQILSQILAQQAGAAAGPIGLLAGALLGRLFGGKRTPSAAGGWWDTGSYEGLAYIHKREMVADAPLANAIRSGNAGGGNTTINVNGNLDGKGVFRTLTASDGDVARAMKRMQRRRRA